ncbi:S8 family serine peptidase [Nocardioides sp.]|uniref:S8 family serine peptidase n=1 Tax=Nocardioides sp. TaxID=35761 RepID=UPI003784EF86
MKHVAAVLAAALAATAGALAPPAPASGQVGALAEEGRLYLVTLEAPAADGLLGALRARGDQDAVLAAVGGPTPVYRWTTALNGVAVRLTADQAAELRSDPGVALVERDTVRRLAGRAARSEPPLAAIPGVVRRDRGGAGVVVGVVDTGIAPDHPAFAATSGLGRAPSGFRGSCSAGEGWPADSCTRKLVGARWFVDGFGADRVRSSESLSPLDEDGHGTQVASVAAGDAGVTARVRGQRLGTYSGVAPQARIAVYKACWTAPDPADDGCSTADLVSAVDAATADGVDVLNLSVGGPAGFDTLERALLGAAEQGTVVVAAAGNAPTRAAAHPSPWVTTVGATLGPVREGRVRTAGGPALTGAMASSRQVGPARLVVGARVPAAGARSSDARVCRPGSLDAARVEGRVVLCARGEVARVDKSAAVALADGVGMVLVNNGPGSLVADFHDVPTVHLREAAGRVLRHWLHGHPAGRVRLTPLGAARSAPRVAPWSSSGDPGGAVLKPDLVATGTGILGAVPGDPAWDLAAGTSVATAATSGAAALLVSRHPDWSAAVVRSVLATTARPLRDAPALRAGAGHLLSDLRVRPGLAYDVAPGDYRPWLAGTLDGDLNTPSVLLAGDADTATRTITNVTGRRLYFSSHATGFERHQVRVVPAAVRLGPGESASFTILVGRTSVPQPDDDGWVTWRGATGTVTRIPVLVTH